MLRLRYLVATMKASSNNYYEVLGLKLHASHAQVKSSFYRLAKEHHPDRSQDHSTEATKAFHLIRQAFEVLSDSHRRRLYDSTLLDKDEQPKKGRNDKYTQRGAKPEDFEFEAEDRYFKRSFLSMRRPSPGEDVYESVRISLSDAVRGATKHVKFARKEVCKECQRGKLQKCFTCGGKGKLHIKRSKSESACDRCEGRGYFSHCQSCSGQGFVSNLVAEEVSVPKGADPQTVLRKQRAGHQGYKSKNGDLYVRVQIEPDKQFEVEGNNIRSVCYVPVSAAVLGGKMLLRTLYGQVEITLAAGVQSGDEKRLTNLGLPSMYSKQLGDHIVTLKINIPQGVDAHSRSLYEALRVAE